MGNSYKSEFWYRRALKLKDQKIEWNLYLGEALMRNGRYAEAQTYLAKYIELNKADLKAIRMFNSCDSLEVYFRDTTLYTISELRYNARGINVFSPAYYRNGIVFISDMSYKGLSKTKSDLTGKRYLDLFYAKKTDRGNWLDPEPLRGEINGRFNEGPVVFSKDFNKVYFTRNNYSSNKIEKNRKSINVLKIYEANFVDGLWKINQPLELTDAEYSVGHPALNSNGDILYFVSNIPWGYGGTDIYYSKKNGNKWSPPINMGPVINSEGNEMFPFLQNDSLLNFASDGKGGLGGLDVFEAKCINGTWSAPFNLGSPVNSSQDDFSFIADSSGLNGYFSSGRLGGSDKLFAFTKNPPKLVIKVKVTDEKTHIPIANALVTVKKDGKVLIASKSDEEGSVRLMVDPDHDYDFTCDDRNYYLRKSAISTVGRRFSDTLNTDIQLKKIQLNKPIVWFGINFKKKTVDIKPSGKDAIDLLFDLLNENPRLEVEIGSYTDTRGSDLDNLKLTQQRADFILNYFAEKGLNPNRFVAKGYGETKLLNKCVNGLLCIEEEHETNNRIELMIRNISDISLK
jgi:outer membrane protein OmpA-like peptidoglycan-associated protein